MIVDIYENIIKKENLFNFNIFIDNYNTFEEIPLISRYDHLNFLSKMVQKEDFQPFLINTANFLLNNIDLYAKNVLTIEEYENYFICITFYDFEDINEFGYVIPNFFVTRKKNILGFLKNQEYSSSDGINFITSAFEQLGLNSFHFFKTNSQNNKYGDLVRIYALNRNNRKKMSF